MCVIIAKAKSVNAPTIKTIKDAINANPDGFSIVWAHDGKLETFKTMKANEMIDYYTKHFVELDKNAFVFHARIATNGSKGLKNCHGWKTLNGRAAFFHNGVLSLRSRGDMTDSETFLRDIYEPIALTSGHKKAERAIEACIGSSKFAFISDEGVIRLYGHYIDRDGVKFSNLNHERSHTLWYSDSSYPRHMSYIDYYSKFVKNNNRIERDSEDLPF